MAVTRGFPLALILLTAAARAQDLPPASPAEEVTPDAVPQDIAPGEAVRDPVREEFVRAREEYAAFVAGALTSEELAFHVRRITGEFLLRRAERDAWELRQQLGALQASGRDDTAEFRRLAEQAAVAEAELDQLRRTDPAEAPPGDWGGATPARDVIVQRLQAKMAEETEFLADTLDARELKKRTRRLRRLVGLGRVVGQFRGARPARQRVQIDDAPAVGPGVVPAGAETAASDPELGPATTVPPAFPDRKANSAGPDLRK